MDCVPENALCKIFQFCNARERCQLRLVCKEWLEVLSPDSHLAWENVAISNSDLCQSLFSFIQKHAPSISTFSAPLIWTVNDQQALSYVRQILYTLQVKAERLTHLSLTMPDKHAAVIHEQADHLNFLRYYDFTSGPSEIDRLLDYVKDLKQLQELTLLNFSAPLTNTDFPDCMIKLTSLTISFNNTGQELSIEQGSAFWKGIGKTLTLQNLSVSNFRAQEGWSWGDSGNMPDDNEIPESIGALTDLRTLEIQNCGLGNLPESFSRLQKLESFRFLESPQKFSNLSHLQALTHLVVATENSRACSSIPNLKILVMEPGCTDTAPLREVTPLMTGMWNALEDLDLGKLNLRHLPHAVTRMASLKRLMLKDNSLSSLPEGTYLENLEQLDLARNSFSRIPQALCQAQKLKRFRISENEDLYFNEESMALILSLSALIHLDLTKEFCNADDDFMDLDLCTGWASASVKCLTLLKRAAPPSLRILCNV